MSNRFRLVWSVFLITLLIGCMAWIFFAPSVAAALCLVGVGIVGTVWFRNLHRMLPVVLILALVIPFVPRQAEAMSTPPIPQTRTASLDCYGATAYFLGSSVFMVGSAGTVWGLFGGALNYVGAMDSVYSSCGTSGSGLDLSCLSGWVPCYSTTYYSDPYTDWSSAFLNGW